MVFDRQEPLLKNKFGVGTSAQTFHYLPQNLVPNNQEEEWELFDLIEHEICHWFIEAEEPMGNYMVEGLNTYLARKILCNHKIIDSKGWNYFLNKSYQETIKNPFGKSVSILEAENKFTKQGYGSLMYTKAALITYLLDQKISILDFSKLMFKEKVSKGKMISEKDLREYLGKHSEYFTQLKNSKDLTEHLQKSDINKSIRTSDDQ
jgi:hypothetical protein